MIYGALVIIVRDNSMLEQRMAKLELTSKDTADDSRAIRVDKERWKTNVLTLIWGN